jgi:hypothetical protein
MLHSHNISCPLGRRDGNDNPVRVAKTDIIAMKHVWDHGSIMLHDKGYPVTNLEVTNYGENPVAVPIVMNRGVDPASIRMK